MAKKNLKKLIIVGAGGHGREILWLAQNINKRQMTYQILGFCDDRADLAEGHFADLPLLGRAEDCDARLADKPFFAVGVGDNATRKKVAERLEALGWLAETLIDPSAIVAEGVEVGAGAFVGVASNISPAAVIGRHVIVHNQSSVGHDTLMGDFSQVAPGGRVLGHAKVGECGYLGANSVVYPAKNIGDFAVLGACSFAIADVPDRAVAIGVPARVRLQGGAEALENI